MVFAILLVLRKVNLRHGELFLSYVTWYSIGRFFYRGSKLNAYRASKNSSNFAYYHVILFIFRRIKGYANVRYLENGA